MLLFKEYAQSMTTKTDNTLDIYEKVPSKNNYVSASVIARVSNTGDPCKRCDCLYVRNIKKCMRISL